MTALRWSFCWIAVVLLAGCGGAGKTPPEPLPAPSAQTRLSHFAGSPLSGPTKATIPAPPPREALSARVELVALENIPTLGQPLGAEARLILATRLGTPVLPSARLAGAMRVVNLPSADAFPTEVVAASKGRTRPFFAERSAIPKGATAIVEVTSARALDYTVAGAGSVARLQVYISRPTIDVPPDQPQPVQIAVAIEDVIADQDESADPAIAPRRIAHRELLMFDRQVDGRQAIALVGPLALDGGAIKGLAMLIDLSVGDDSNEHLEALSAAMVHIRESADFAASRPTTLPTGRAELAALRAASESLSTTQRLRPTLVYLAGQTGAHLYEDVALVADDSVLKKLAEQGKATIDGALNAGLQAADSSVVGWLLDKAAFQLLGRLLNEGKLPPELASVLARHAGEAGRNVASIEEVSRNLTSRQDMESRLLAENLIYLEDSSPAARVRAYDWLAARGRAPAGFDPLGPAKERRVALEKGMAAAAAGPATAPAK